MKTLNIALFFCLIFGWCCLFSNHAFYDDEGYILYTAREVFKGHSLYDHVYSQYGISFYLVTTVIQNLFGILTSNGIRVLCLACWGLAAWGSGLFCLRVSKKPGLAALCAAATFLFLYYNRDEPLHPGIFIIAALALLTSAPIRVRGRDIIYGVITGFLLGMKINVGLLLGVSLFLWYLRGWNTLPGLILKLAIVSLALFLLTKALLLDQWVLIFDASILGGTLSILLREKGPAPKPAEFLKYAAATLAVVTGLLVYTHGQGSSWTGILHGTVLDAIKHPLNYSYPVDWRTGTVASIVLGLGASLLHRFGKLPPRGFHALRILHAAFLGAAIFMVMDYRAIGLVFSFTAPWLWLWVEEDTSLVAWVLLFQMLHAYPIGGIQEAWGVFLVFPLVLSHVRDSLAQVPGLLESRPLGYLLSGLALAKVIEVSACIAVPYAKGTALPYPTASWIRLPTTLETEYAAVTDFCILNCDTLFSGPGMLSFNVWAAKPAPSQKNTTLWWTLLSRPEQAHIQHVLENTRSLTILQNDTVADAATTDFGPLMRYILAQPVAFKTGDFTVYGSTRAMHYPRSVVRKFTKGRTVALEFPEVLHPGDEVQIYDCKLGVGPVYHEETVRSATRTVTFPQTVIPISSNSSLAGVVRDHRLTALYRVGETP